MAAGGKGDGGLPHRDTHLSPQIESGDEGSMADPLFPCRRGNFRVSCASSLSPQPTIYLRPLWKKINFNHSAHMCRDKNATLSMTSAAFTTERFAVFFLHLFAPGKHLQFTAMTAADFLH